MTTKTQIRQYHRRVAQEQQALAPAQPQLKLKTLLDVFIRRFGCEASLTQGQKPVTQRPKNSRERRLQRQMVAKGRKWAKSNPNKMWTHLVRRHPSLVHQVLADEWRDASVEHRWLLWSLQLLFLTKGQTTTLIDGTKCRLKKITGHRLVVAVGPTEELRIGHQAIAACIHHSRRRWIYLSVAWHRLVKKGVRPPLPGYYLLNKSKQLLHQCIQCGFPAVAAHHSLSMLSLPEPLVCLLLSFILCEKSDCGFCTLPLHLPLDPPQIPTQAQVLQDVCCLLPTLPRVSNRRSKKQRLL